MYYIKFIFKGDLKDEEKVLAWLTDLDSMELPDKIEEVNAKILENLIEDSDFLAVLLCKIFLSFSFIHNDESFLNGENNPFNMYFAHFPFILWLSVFTTAFCFPGRLLYFFWSNLISDQYWTIFKVAFFIV